MRLGVVALLGTLLFARSASALGPGDTTWTWRNGSYINVDLGVDLRFAKHAFLRPYFGGGKLVHS
jgi:hypothetical protein